MPSRSLRHPATLLVLFGLIVAATPLAWRGALWAWGPSAADAPASYLPALEATRHRRPFDDGPVTNLAGMSPGYIVIGDSMAGRIDPRQLSALAGAPVVPLLQNATGPAYWFLVFKNWVVASGVRPKAVIVFFRDTNLTDPTFRLTGPYRTGLDEVARDREDELNGVIARRTSGSWHRAHRWVSAAYRVEPARDWLTPVFTTWPARLVAGRDRQAALVLAANDAFTLDKLRPIAQADLGQAAEGDLDFRATVDTSVLPEFLKLAKAHDVTLRFVRVMRRPVVPGEAPPQTAALRAYIADLRAYLEAHGATLLDDYQDPPSTRLAYADGDHIAIESRAAYTERFWTRIHGSPR